MSLRTITLAFLVLAAAPSAVACTCITQPLEKSFAASAFVFRARITAAKEVRAGKNEHIAIDVDIREMLKGKKLSVPTLTTRFEGVCGLPMTIGREYLLFIGSDGRVWLCSGSQELSPSNQNVLSKARTLARATIGVRSLR